MRAVQLVVHCTRVLTRVLLASGLLGVGRGVGGGGGGHVSLGAARGGGGWGGGGGQRLTIPNGIGPLLVRRRHFGVRLDGQGILNTVLIVRETAVYRPHVFTPRPPTAFPAFLPVRRRDARIDRRSFRGTSELVVFPPSFSIKQQPEGPTWEFNPESGALGVARCPSGALSGALIRASSGTVWSRDLQASRGQ